jgi:hypothetical protein
MPLEGRYGYFALQARCDPKPVVSGRVSGVLENLATGEKWRFESARELGELLDDWGHDTSLG